MAEGTQSLHLTHHSSVYRSVGCVWQWLVLPVSLLWQPNTFYIKGQEGISVEENILMETIFCTKCTKIIELHKMTDLKNLNDSQTLF